MGEHKWGNIDMPTSANPGVPDTRMRLGRERGVLEMIRQTMADDKRPPLRIGPTWWLLNILTVAPTILGYWYWLHIKTKEIEALDLDMGEGGQFRVRTAKRLDITQDAVVETGEGLASLEAIVAGLKRQLSEAQKDAAEARALARALYERQSEDDAKTARTAPPIPVQVDTNPDEFAAQSLAQSSPTAPATERPALRQLSYVPVRKRCDDPYADIMSGEKKATELTARAARVSDQATEVEVESPFRNGLISILYRYGRDAYRKFSETNTEDTGD